MDTSQEVFVDSSCWEMDRAAWVKRKTEKGGIDHDIFGGNFQSLTRLS